MLAIFIIAAIGMLLKLGFGITGQSSRTSSNTTINNDNSVDNSARDNKVAADGGSSVLSSGGGALQAGGYQIGNLAKGASVNVSQAAPDLDFARGIFDTAFKSIGDTVGNFAKGGSGGSGGGGVGTPIVLPAAVGGATLPGWALPVAGVVGLVGLFLLLRKKG